MKSLFPVILCGGSGTRLWPLSRATLPKQFLPLLSSRTMLQETALLFEAELAFHAPILVCSNAQRFVAAEQIREIGVRPVVHLLEPIGRNTAPAIAVAAFAGLAEDPEALLLVVPSDLLIKKRGVFQNLIAKARTLALAGRLVTFGIEPAFAETGYGYIRRGAQIDRAGGVFEVALFANKPDSIRATGFLRAGGYLWNSGMFVFKAARYLEELGKYRKDILDAAKASWAAATRDLDFVRLDEKAFLACPSESIDYAVMEKTDDAVVVEADIGWSDMGSWAALWQAGQPDAGGNVTVGDVYAEDVHNCYVRAEHRLVAAVGLKDLIIVETSDAVLVTHKDRSQEVKKIVDALKAKQRAEYLIHNRVYHPWGYYEGIENSDRFQVKRIMVKPGCKLSFQMHHHRAEHWIVVSGTARVIRGEETLLLSENQSTYIPLGAKHRLENVGKMPLHMIEVQSGSYLGEDDTVRPEDDYKKL